MDEPDYIRAHKHSIRHHDEILASESCGCFYCSETFPPDGIKDWIDEPIEGGRTALCPNCGIDSVIGSASGFTITTAFLNKMNEYWFQRTISLGDRGASE